MNLRGIPVKVFCGKGRTHQSFSKDADINNIMGRYKKTGLLPVSRVAPNFGDFSDVVDLTDTLARIKAAEVAFGVLPAATREKFGNDVAKLLDFVQDPANLKEAVNLKLLPESMLPKPTSPQGVVGSQPTAGTEPKAN